jgi:hypothetical protein
MGLPHYSDTPPGRFRERHVGFCLRAGANLLKMPVWDDPRLHIEE